MARISNEEILKILNEILDKLPNGELNILRIKIDELKEDISSMAGEQSKLIKNLYNPEDGLVVRINRNSEYRKALQEERALETIRTVDKFRSNYNKLLWGLYALLIGIFLKEKVLEWFF